MNYFTTKLSVMNRLPYASLILAALWLSLGSGLLAADGSIMYSMDELQFKAQGPKVKVDLVEGKFDQALKLTFEDGAKAAYAVAKSGGTPAWDEADGFSFWLRGDGSDRVGGLEFVWNGDFGVRYAYAFPLKNTEWHKVTVAWRDLTPELAKPSNKPLDVKSGNAPSKLGPLWLGKWWYWRDYGAHSYTVDEFRLEPKLDYPKDDQPEGDPLARIKAKLKAGKPIKIVTMGDSLTDTAHWANRKTNWPKMLAAELERKHGSMVTLVNPAIGGTELQQNVVLIPSWAGKHADADLVTFFFGGNDWNSGMRGEQFEAVCRNAIRRIRRAADGAADVIVMGTAPGAQRWKTYDELSEAARRAANRDNAAFADVQAAFHQAGKDDPAKLFVHDKDHLSEAGHQVVRDAVLKLLERE